MSSRCYLLNSPIITAYGDWRLEGPISLDSARHEVESGFVSAIGHEGSAAALSALLGVQVEVNRVAIQMEVGDRALVLRVKARLPEGMILDAKAMEDFPWELSLLRRLA